MTKRNREEFEIANVGEEEEEEEERQRMLEAQYAAAAESHFWLQAAMEIQSTIASVYADVEEYENDENTRPNSHEAESLLLHSQDPMGGF
jgi:hypothetical protein